MDSRNDETFGDASSSVTVKPFVVNAGKNNDGTQGSSRFSSMVISYPTLNSCCFLTSLLKRTTRDAQFIRQESETNNYA